MSQIVNITDLRFKIGSLIQSITSANPVVLLKRGRPILALIPYSDFEDFELYLSNKKTLQKVAKTKTLQNLFTQSNTIDLSKTAQKWLLDNKIESQNDTWDFAEQVSQTLAQESKGSDI